MCVCVNMYSHFKTQWTHQDHIMTHQKLLKPHKSHYACPPESSLKVPFELLSTCYSIAQRFQTPFMSVSHPASLGSIFPTLVFHNVHIEITPLASKTNKNKQLYQICQCLKDKLFSLPLFCPISFPSCHLTLDLIKFSYVNMMTSYNWRPKVIYTVTFWGSGPLLHVILPHDSET